MRLCMGRCLPNLYMLLPQLPTFQQLSVPKLQLQLQLQHPHTVRIRLLVVVLIRQRTLPRTV